MKLREIATHRQKGSKGYTAPKRQKATYTTGSLGAGSYEMGTIDLAISYKVLRIKTSSPARVRLYDSDAGQAGDVARAIGVDPGDGSGVILEFVSTSGLLTATLSPLVSGTSTEFTPSKRIPITVTNTDTSSTPITVTLTWIEEE